MEVMEVLGVMDDGGGMCGDGSGEYKHLFANNKKHLLRIE